MRGFWADEKVDNGQWDQKKILFRKIYKHYKSKERDFLTNADAIISLTHAGKKHLLNQEMCSSHVSIHVIPCCADLEHFNYERVPVKELQQLRTSLNIAPYEKIITYLGSVGGWYMTKEMFRFFKALLEVQPLYKMLILTKDNAEKVKSEAAEEGIAEDRVIVTYSDRKHLPQYLSLSNCSIFFIRNSFSKIASSPTKHAELMGMGIPVVCNNIGDTGNIIELTKTGLLINEFDPSSIKKAVAQMVGLEQINKELIRKSAKEYFDLKNGATMYLSVYKNILGDTAEVKQPAKP
jgi:glycosyltransferase involved in cell wall biosynthesis